MDLGERGRVFVIVPKQDGSSAAGISVGLDKESFHSLKWDLFSNARSKHRDRMIQIESLAVRGRDYDYV